MRTAAVIVIVIVAIVASACAPAVGDPGTGTDGGDGNHDADLGADLDADLDLDLDRLALVSSGPFAAVEGAAIVPCGPGGILHEATRVEVRTEWCDPADLGMSLDDDLAAGTGVEVTMSHDALFADGGDVHLALVVGDEVV